MSTFDQDLLTRFNAPNYSVWQILTGNAPDQVAPKNEAEESEEQRANWRAAYYRMTLKKKATRVNLESTLGRASGMAKQVKDIAEARRAA